MQNDDPTAATGQTGAGSHREVDAPVLQALDDVRESLRCGGAAVLVSPPGTGKTTELPPALALAPFGDPKSAGPGRIVVVVPRRMAARAAANRMASRHGDRLGRMFGYTVRHDSRTSKDTRVEVVTPGILLRRMQADPSLEGTSTVIVDEFHERSVDQDLLLALLIEARSALREDLALLVMSATLDAAPVAQLLGDAPMIEVESQLYPIRTIHRPGSAHARLEDRVCDVITEALAEGPGDVLVFLPGRGEIRAAARTLGRRGSVGVDVLELHGSVPPERTDEILSPTVGAGRRRRVVLSTAVAETSITVPGVRMVVDSGRRRSSEVDQRTGLPGLVTRAISNAGADQRRGRCGREAPGTCYRMWAEREEETLRATDPPEIVVADLSPLLLQVLDWGAQPEELAWLDPPPAASQARAVELLGELGAVVSRDGPHGGADSLRNQLTGFGHRLARLGFHPRIGAIAADGSERGQTDLAAEIAAVLESDGGDHLEVSEAVRAVRLGDSSESLRRSLKQWRRQLRTTAEASSAATAARRGDPSGERDPSGDMELDRGIGQLLLAGYADRLARRREGRADTYHLRSGGEVTVRSKADLGEWVVVISLDAKAGSGKPGVAYLLAAVHDDDVANLVAESEAAGLIERSSQVHWDPATGSVHTDTQRRLGAILLDSVRSSGADRADLTAAVTKEIEDSGPDILPGYSDTESLRSRIAFASANGMDCPSSGASWPESSPEELSRDARWLAEVLVGSSAASTAGTGTCRHLSADAAVVGNALRSRLSWEDTKLLDREVPKRWMSPGGRELRLRYGALDGDAASVMLSCRLQDMLGIDDHPSIGRRAIPVTVELLSPAGRPLQRTTDLPGFWRGTYSQVRGEMRGRYPKHRWPERPWDLPAST